VEGLVKGRAIDVNLKICFIKICCSWIADCGETE
jgi:hypothetical protein